MRLFITLVVVALAASLAAPPVSAKAKFIKVTAGKPGQFFGAGAGFGLAPRLKLFTRRPVAFVHPTGFAIPHRRLAEHSPFEQKIRFPTPEWAYSRFKRHADFGQRSDLWQTHLKPSPGYPNE